MLPSLTFHATAPRCCDVHACADTPYAAIIAISSMTTRFPSPRSARSRRERSFIKKERRRKGRVEAKEDAYILGTIEQVVISRWLYLFLFASGATPPWIFQIGNRALGRNSRCTFGSAPSRKRFYRIVLLATFRFRVDLSNRIYSSATRCLLLRSWH